MSGVKVMRRGEDPQQESPDAQEPNSKRLQADDGDSGFFCNILSTGQKVCIRAMRASDIMWMETLDKGKDTVGDVQKSLKLFARLSTKTNNPITFSSLTDLSMADLKIVTDLLSKASGTGEDEDEDDSFDPNF